MSPSKERFLPSMLAKEAEEATLLCASWDICSGVMPVWSIKALMSRGGFMLPSAAVCQVGQRKVHSARQKWS